MCKLTIKDIKSDKFKEDITYVRNPLPEEDHKDCIVKKYTEILHNVSTHILMKKAKSYQVCETHSQYREIPFNKQPLDNHIFFTNPDWVKFEEETVST